MATQDVGETTPHRFKLGVFLVRAAARQRQARPRSENISNEKKAGVLIAFACSVQSLCLCLLAVSAPLQREYRAPGQAREGRKGHIAVMRLLL